MKKLVALIDTKNKTSEQVSAEAMAAVHQIAPQTHHNGLTAPAMAESNIKLTLLSNRQLRWIIGVILLALLGSFYWFQYRPAKIRQDCQEAVTRGSTDDLRRDYGSSIGGGTYYTRCLASKGL